MMIHDEGYNAGGMRLGRPRKAFSLRLKIAVSSN